MDAIAAALCDCLRLDGVRTTNLASLSDQDWVEVSALARRHVVSTLFYRFLKSHANEIHPPTGVMAALRKASLYASASSIRHELEISQVLHTLQNVGVPVIVLKGAYLAEKVYDNPAERLMSDLDLLVQFQDLERTVTVLETTGYRTQGPVSVEFETQDGHHLQPLNKKGSLSIEIHWTLVTPGFPQQLDIAGLWLRAELVKIAQAEALALAAEDLLLHLCFHATYHHTFRNGLRGLTDVAYVMRRFGASLNWDAIASRAHASRTTAPVYLAVRLAVELLGAPLPPGALETLRPVGFDDHAVTIGVELLFTDQNIVNLVTPDLARSANEHSFFPWVKILLERIFLPRTTMARMYPAKPDSPKIYFYYLLRFRVVWKRYRRVGWGLLRRKPNLVAVADQVRQLVKTQERLKELIKPDHS